MNPQQVVTQFLDRWNTDIDGIRAALRETLAADAPWDNVGLSVTHGPEEAMPILDAFVAQTGFARMGVDMVNICANGNVVFTERVDRFFARDGKEIMALRVNGVFEVGPDGKIAAWRDYFDTKALG